MDFSVLYFIQDNLRNPALDVLMPFLSIIGGAGAVWVISCLSMLFFKNTRIMGITGLIAIGMVLIVGEFILKNIFCRIRPCNIDMTVEMLVARPKSYSFPSGHTGTSFACATAFFAYNKKIGIPALILAALIGFSRMYNFVHFPSDVLAGMILGILIAVVSFLIVRTLQNRLDKSTLRE